MTTKLKIDLSQGLLEVEGSESFVRTIYSDFKTHFAGIEEATEENKKSRRSRKSKTPAKSKVAVAAKTTNQQVAPEVEEAAPEPKAKITPVPTYTYLEKLNLGATKNQPALVDFMDAKFPITNEERNIVFVYYLQYIRKLKSITPDHVYTCYRAAKIRAPLNIEHSLTRRDWIELTEDGQLTLTAAGKDYVEKQLPKKVKN